MGYFEKLEAKRCKLPFAPNALPSDPHLIYGTKARCTCGEMVYPVKDGDEWVPSPHNPAERPSSKRNKGPNTKRVDR
jgi:hypothetical protein